MYHLAISKHSLFYPECIISQIYLILLILLFMLIKIPHTYTYYSKAKKEHTMQFVDIIQRELEKNTQRLKRFQQEIRRRSSYDNFSLDVKCEKNYDYYTVYFPDPKDHGKRHKRYVGRHEPELVRQIQTHYFLSQSIKKQNQTSSSLIKSQRAMRSWTSMPRRNGRRHIAVFLRNVLKLRAFRISVSGKTNIRKHITLVNTAIRST